MLVYYHHIPHTTELTVNFLRVGEFTELFFIKINRATTSSLYFKLQAP